jgi:hypothetical protein
MMRTKWFSNTFFNSNNSNSNGNNSNSNGGGHLMTFNY